MNKIVLGILAVVAVLMLISGYRLVRNTDTPLPSASVSVAPLPSVPSSSANYYFPMTRYSQRMTNRWYGKEVVASDNQGLSCGAPFSGLHTGDDLEIFKNERDAEVPVYAVAQGTVRQVDTVGGYGGLVVIEHVLNNQRVTAYYGHVDISSSDLKTGSTVIAGQKIALLGDECSTQTSGERKHLHFSIHKGTGLNVRGYVDTPSQLQAWLNPKETLQQLSAVEVNDGV